MAAVDGALERARVVARDVVAPAADDVDREARFPKEALEALRAERLLSVLVPERLGGGGASLPEVARVAEVLGRACASTGMIYAMHQIQVACLVRHGTTEPFYDYLSEEVAGRQALLASATTEVGVGGDVRTSLCAVEEHDGRMRLEKRSPVISYGQQADAVLATARRTPDSPASDQVLVLCQRPGLVLEPISGWDTLGFRGTCSLGFVLRAEAPTSHILPEPYADISSRTMLPVSHLLWSHVWFGIADAASAAAQGFVRALARKQPGVTPPAALRLAELMNVRLQFEALVRHMARRYEEISADLDALDQMSFAVAMNSLKVAASTLVVDVVGRAMQICGMAGYRADSELGLERLLRDAHGAALMVNNDRILANSAHLLLVAREAG